MPEIRSLAYVARKHRDKPTPMRRGRVTTMSFGRFTKTLSKCPTKGPKQKAAKSSSRASLAINLRGKGPHNKSRYDKTHPKFDVIRRDSDDRRAEANTLLNTAIRVPCQEWPV